MQIKPTFGNAELKTKNPLGGDTDSGCLLELDDKQYIYIYQLKVKDCCGDVHTREIETIAAKEGEYTKDSPRLQKRYHS